MSTRRETEYRKSELKRLLREECRNGTLASGSLLPSVRELAARHVLSPILVRQVLQLLEEDGILYTVPRVGTFVGPRAVVASDFYLLYLPCSVQADIRFVQVKAGFEERIASHGGATLILTLGATIPMNSDQRLPALAGVFDFGEAPFPTEMLQEPPSARVRFAGDKHSATGIDLVSFDDVDGGRRAAEHLLQAGHRKIAFLGLHPAEGDPGVFGWSAEREMGWRQALLREGIDPAPLTYHVTRTGSFDQTRAARDAAEPLVRRPDVTAVVTANDMAAQGLLSALREALVPLGRWPAIIGFDDDPRLAGLNVSSYRLPWDEVGRAAADLLWERKQGKAAAVPVHRQVPMRLIQRVTGQANWPLRVGGTAFVAL